MILKLFLDRNPTFYIKNSVEFSLSSYIVNLLPVFTLHQAQEPARIVYVLKEMLG